MYGDAQSRGLTQCTFQGRRPPSRLMSYRFTPCMQGRISLSSSPESSRHAIVLSPVSLNLHSPTQAHVATSSSLYSTPCCAARTNTLESKPQSMRRGTRATIRPASKAVPSGPVLSRAPTSLSRLGALCMRSLCARLARRAPTSRGPSCPTSWPSSSCPSGCSDCEQRTGDASEGRRTCTCTFDGRQGACVLQ